MGNRERTELRLCLSTTVQAHTFDVARELQRRGQLAALFSGYPRRKLASRGLAGREIVCNPLPVLGGLLVNRLTRSQKVALRTEPWPKILFDRWVSRRLPDCDAFMATSSVGLFSGREAKRRGAIWICDRPCSHILTQEGLLREEHERWGQRWPGIHRRIIERELEEYRESHAVLVASTFAFSSFRDHGFPEARLWLIPYGVDLRRFHPAGSPDPEGFLVLFVGQMSLQKGVPYLLDAFVKVKHPKKRLVLVGAGALPFAQCPDMQVTGPLPQYKVRDWMSKAHVLVLPSIQDGYGMVVDQAMACGCPCVVSRNAGAADAIQEGLNGYTFRARDVEELAELLQRLADDPQKAASMREAAREAALKRGGWEAFTDRLLQRVSEARRAS
ncbi:MAG: glycosyltransferase family 4 protein [Fimbriimonadales bacterium]|nr:glycosyltransferase family 4 protein [Fimbriimonadales bacterium]